MKMLKTFNNYIYIALFIIVTACSGHEQNTNRKPDINTIDVKLEHRIDSVMCLLSIEEKIGQMVQFSDSNEQNIDLENLLLKGQLGAVLNVNSGERSFELQKIAIEKSAHGIPLLFGFNVVHGYQTIFPIPLAESASWDTEAVRNAAAVAAKEAALDGINWTFAPSVDVFRDARKLKVVESLGEDTYLVSQIAKAQVNGFQGDNLADQFSIAACAKYFAGEGFTETGIDNTSVEVSDNTLQNVIFPPFKACIEAGVLTMMNSFFDIGGIPTTGNKKLLRNILKDEWGFNGFVISEHASIAKMQNQGYAKTLKHATRIAIEAGNDSYIGEDCFQKSLLELANNKEIKEDLINDAVRRILRVKFLLGLFDDPYKYCSSNKAHTLESQDNRDVARDLAKKSIVLLKNDKQLLPLKNRPSKILVVGSLANSNDIPLGNWQGKNEKKTAVSVLDGLKNNSPENVDIKYIEGYKLLSENNNSADYSEFNEVLKEAKIADKIILVVGENLFNLNKGQSICDIRLPAIQEELLEKIEEINDNIILIIMNGRPLDLTYVSKKVSSILEVWYLGSESGNAIADVVYGNYNPSGKLPMSFPRSVSQCPIYYNHKNNLFHKVDNPNINYTDTNDLPNTPLYPFGFGLSYTTFNYSEIMLNQKTINKNETIQATISVTNTGSYDGTEVVQLYLCDMVASVTRPIKELKGFKNLSLMVGETSDVTFTISANDLAFYNSNNEWSAEPGQFRIFIGGNSVNLKETTITLE